MSKFRLTMNILALAIFTLTVTSLAQAQTRTWVSGVGDDLNPCSRTAPCKTYAGAISKTATNGEISTLDLSGFGSGQHYQKHHHRWHSRRGIRFHSRLWC